MWQTVARMIVTRTIYLEEIVCGTCRITFAIPTDWKRERINNAGDIHCPNGCRKVWTESESDRLKKQLEQKERELRESKCETLRQSQLKEAAQSELDKKTRKLNRVQNGVCPHCNRSFMNLKRHMKTKHCCL